ncbi:MASE3 domain-containing protein [Candidatus Halobeggiatoa sp. HSG11]|nr:MASE3 domain-containing protein [Candidatus Halobeggiatoa sp. HSG11]
MNNKFVTYVILTISLFIGYFLLRDVAWQGTKQLHTLMEVIASLLALLIGIMALLQYYSKKNITFLFIGTGFLGTSCLDIYHTVVTSTFFDLYFPSPPPSLIPWSWLASRMFLAFSLWLSWIVWNREQKLGKSQVTNESIVYSIAILLTIGCFIFFAFVPLPRAYYPELFFHRPEEFIPAIFFLLALIGYLKKGHWQTNIFEHWLVLSLIVNFMGQVMFMSFSGHLFDNMFDSAHLLKKVSYICVLIGLLCNIYIMYKNSEKYTKQLSENNEDLQIMIKDIVKISQGIADGNLQTTPKAEYKGDFVQIKASLESALLSLNSVVKDIVQVSQGLADGNLRITTKAEYKGDFVQIKDSMEIALSSLNKVVKDTVQVSQGLADGNLRVIPKAEYKGDFVKIKNALETTLLAQSQVIEDIVQVSQGLANGSKNVVAKADYQGDFIQIKTALEAAANKLSEAMAQNTIQNWLKTGQTELSKKISGELEIIDLAKNICDFLTTYLEAQVGAFYIVEEETRIKLIASYAYSQRKGLPNEFQLGEGLVGQAILEKQKILVTDVPENYISIHSGIGEAVPKNILVMPFMYENSVKGAIEIGSFHEFTETQLELLEQVMPNIGITMNTAESRTKMQALLQSKN